MPARGRANTARYATTPSTATSRGSHARTVFSSRRAPARNSATVSRTVRPGPPMSRSVTRPARPTGPRARCPARHWAEPVPPTLEPWRPAAPDRPAAGPLHEPCVGGLVVGGGVGVGNQHGGLAVGGDLEDRTAGARHHQVAGQQRLAEPGDIAAQVVVLSGGVQVVQVALAGGVQDPKPGAGERLDRGLVDRAGALRAA